MMDTSCSKNGRMSLNYLLHESIELKQSTNTDWSHHELLQPDPNTNYTSRPLFEHSLYFSHSLQRSASAIAAKSLALYNVSPAKSSAYTGSRQIPGMVETSQAINYEQFREEDCRMLKSAPLAPVQNNDQSYLQLSSQASPASHGRRDSRLPVSRSTFGCDFKRSRSLGRNKRMWTPAEDALLQRVAGEEPENWNLIGAAVPGRTGKQCRERWLNNLRPNVRKGHWTREEDELILREQAVRGNAWSAIARLLAGRSDNATKNRYNSYLARQVRSGLDGQSLESNFSSDLPSQTSLESGPTDGSSDDRSSLYSNHGRCASLHVA
jgi:Myb-like DNA-binding domain